MLADIDEVRGHEVMDAINLQGGTAAFTRIDATNEQSVAEAIAAMPPLAVEGLLDAVDRGADMGLDDALALEAGIFGRLCGTEDKREGTRAFLEKRSANWVGR